MRVRPSGQTAHRTRLHVDSAGAFDSRDETFSAEEAGEDAASHAHLQVNGRFVGDKMSGIDDEFAIDLSCKDSAVRSEPDLSVAADFEAKQSFTTDEAGDACPAQPKIYRGFAGQKGSRLKEHSRSFQLDALDVAGERLSENQFARAAGREFVDEERFATEELSTKGTEESAIPPSAHFDGRTHTRHGVGFGDDRIASVQFRSDIGESGFVANFGFHEQPQS